MGKTKKKIKRRDLIHEISDKKKNTTKGVVVVKCCFKEKVQYYYVCSAHSKCNSTAQPVFTWIHLCTKFLNPSNSFVVCTSETTSRPINPFFLAFNALSSLADVYRFKAQNWTNNNGVATFEWYLTIMFWYYFFE